MPAYDDWTNVPVPGFNGAIPQITSWEDDYQFIQALQLRKMARCGRYFPSTAETYAEDEIETISNTEIVLKAQHAKVVAGDGGWECVDGSQESGGPNDLGHGNYFAGYTHLADDGSRTRPQFYDIVVGTDLYKKPYLIRRATLISNGRYTLRVADFGLEPDELTFLQGKRAYILEEGRLSWHERIRLGFPQVQWRSNYSIIGDTQTFTVIDATAGTFTLNANGTNTGNIAFDASAAAVKSLIDTAIGEASTVTKNGKIYTVVFPPDLGDVPLMTANVSGLTGAGPAAPSISFATIFDGPTANKVFIRDNNDYLPYPASWSSGQFTGNNGPCYVGFVSSTFGGYVRFAEIISNGGDWLCFNPNSGGGSGYAIQSPTGPFIISRKGPKPAWYRFANDSAGFASSQSVVVSLEFSALQWHGMSSSCWWTRGSDPISGIPFCGIPIVAVQERGEDETFTCVDMTYRPVFDQVDYKTTFSDLDGGCVPWKGMPGGNPSIYEDEFIHPLAHRSWRGIQVDIEDEATAWIFDKSYTGKVAIPGFVAATHFDAADINTHPTTGTVKIVSGVYDSYTVPAINHGVPDGCPVCWAVEYKDNIVGNGWFWCANGATAIPFDGSLVRCAPWEDDSSTSGSGTPALTGKHVYDKAKVYISYGWTRGTEAMTLYHYDAIGLNPETATDPISGVEIVYTPSAAHPGSWDKRDKSTNFAKFQDQYVPGLDLDAGPPFLPHLAPDNMGQLIDSSEVLPSTGGNIRYMGDSSASVSTPFMVQGISQNEADFYVRGFFEGIWPDNNRYDGQVTGSGPGWFEDADQSWLPWGEWSGYTAVASGGSSSSIEDNTVFPQYDPMTGDLIAGDLRFNSALGRWIGFIIDIVDGPNAGDEAPVTGYTDSTGIGLPATINFNIPNFDWQYTLYKFTAANVEVGDSFTITATGDINQTVTVVAATTSASDVATAFSAIVSGISGLSSETAGDILKVVVRAGVTVAFATSTTNVLGGVASQTLTKTTETKSVTYHLQEPAYKKNPWAQRKVRITPPPGITGFSGVLDCLYNNSTKTWTQQQVTVAIGSVYNFLEDEAGRVFSRNSDGSWTKVVTADDPKGKAVNPDFKKTFGRNMNGDIRINKNRDEAKRAIHILSATNEGPVSGWSALGTDNNIIFHSDGYTDWSDAVSNAVTNEVDLSSDDVAPSMTINNNNHDLQQDEFKVFVQVTRSAPVVNFSCSFIPSTFDVYFRADGVALSGGLSGTTTSWSGCVGDFDSGPWSVTYVPSGTSFSESFDGTIVTESQRDSGNPWTVASANGNGDSVTGFNDGGVGLLFRAYKRIDGGSLAVGVTTWTSGILFGPDPSLPSLIALPRASTFGADVFDSTGFVEAGTAVVRRFNFPAFK